MSKLFSQLEKTNTLSPGRWGSRIGELQGRQRKASNSFDESTCRIETSTFTNQRQRQKYESKIAIMHDKIKKLGLQSERFESRSKELQLTLAFYKLKLQEELTRNQQHEETVEIVASALQKQVQTLQRVLQLNADLNLPSQESSSESNNGDPFQRLIKYSRSLQSQLAKLQRWLSSERAKEMERISNSVNTTLLQAQGKHERQVKVLKKEMSELQAKYQLKVTEGEECRMEIANLLKQRSYTNGLLTSSQREKNVIVNTIYTIGERQLDASLEMMPKPDLILLCLELLAKVKEVEGQKCEAQAHIAKLEAECRHKYKALLREVKSIEKAPATRTGRLKKMTSLPAG